jgi:hypothetical protein
MQVILLLAPTLTGIGLIFMLLLDLLFNLYPLRFRVAQPLRTDDLVVVLPPLLNRLIAFQFCPSIPSIITLFLDFDRVDIVHKGV